MIKKSMPSLRSVLCYVSLTNLGSDKHRESVRGQVCPIYPGGEANSILALRELNEFLKYPRLSEDALQKRSPSSCLGMFRGTSMGLHVLLYRLDWRDKGEG